MAALKHWRVPTSLTIGMKTLGQIKIKTRFSLFLLQTDFLGAKTKLKLIART